MSARTTLPVSPVQYDGLSCDFSLDSATHDASKMFPPELSGLSYVASLGAGSTALVALYEHHDSARWVAVKLCRDANDALLNDLFRNEAAHMEAVRDHPYILPIFGSGVTEDGRGYIMCEYAPNGTLDYVMRFSEQCGMMPVDQVVTIGVHMADALAAAHRHGIVHHDVKPSNILLSASGEPMLADFGIADSVYARNAIGYSAAWAAPECFDEHTRYRPESADAYSLAAVLYALLTGSPPFGYERRPESFSASASPVSVANCCLPQIDRLDVPDELRATLMVALSQDPEQRYFSALDFAHALQDVQYQCFGKVTPLYVEKHDAASQRFANHTAGIGCGDVPQLGGWSPPGRTDSSGEYVRRNRHDVRHAAATTETATTATTTAEARRHVDFSRSMIIGILLIVAMLSLYAALRIAVLDSDAIPAIAPLQVVEPDAIEDQLFSYHTDIAITGEV